MGAWLDRLALFSLDAFVASTILLLVACLMMVACQQPARRSALARLAILGVLAMPVLIWLAPLDRIEITRHLGHFAPPSPPEIETDDSDSQPPHWHFHGLRKFSRILLVVYGLGIFCGLSRLALGYWSLSRVLKRSTEASESSRDLLKSLSQARRSPRLRITDRVGKPVVVGLWWPTILVPPELDRPESTESLRLSLLHELAHADHLDLVFGLLAEIARDLWFPLPPIWWLRAQMRLDQEFLADGGAAFGFGSTGRYASSLLALADPRSRPGFTSTHNSRPDPPAIAGSALFSRVLMLVRCPFPMERRPPRWWLALIILGIGSMTLGLSTLTFGGTSTSMPDPRRSPSTFTLASLTIDSESLATNGPCVSHNLPLRLPREFDLSVELFASVSQLGRVRIAGLPIAPACDDCSNRDGWHLIRMRRDRGKVLLQLDDQPPSTRPCDSPHPPWLSIDIPPGVKLPVRNLTVHW